MDPSTGATAHGSEGLEQCECGRRPQLYSEGERVKAWYVKCQCGRPIVGPTNTPDQAREAWNTGSWRLG